MISAPEWARFAPWVENPYRLWGLRDMLEVNAEAFIRATDALDFFHGLQRATYTSIAKLTLPAGSFSIDHALPILIAYFPTLLEPLRADCVKLNASTSVKLIDNLTLYVERKMKPVPGIEKVFGSESTSNDPFDPSRSKEFSEYFSDILQRCDAIRDALMAELSAIEFIVIPSSKAIYYSRPASDFWGDKAWNTFKACRNDMSESMRCFALDRHTACVFHLCRVMEGALRVFAKKIGVPTSKIDGTPKTWAPLSDQIRSTIKATTPTSAKLRAQRDARLLALDRFDSVRGVRNSCNHPDEEYSEHEAHEFMVHVPGFISQAADSI